MNVDRTAWVERDGGRLVLHWPEDADTVPITRAALEALVALANRAPGDDDLLDEAHNQLEQDR